MIRNMRLRRSAQVKTYRVVSLTATAYVAKPHTRAVNMRHWEQYQARCRRCVYVIDHFVEHVVESIPLYSLLLSNCS